MPIFGILRLALKRMFSQFSLHVCLALGICVVVMFAAAIPAFSDAVQLRVLQTRVDASSEETRRPPFAFMYAYFGSISGQVEYEDFLKDDAFVQTRAPAVIGMPISQTVRFWHTAKFRVFPAANVAGFKDKNSQLEWMSVGVVGNIESHIEIFGSAPKTRNDDVLEVLVYSELANEIGIQTGEDYILFGSPVRGAEPIQQKLRVVGIWAETNANDDFWFYRPDSLKDSFLVSEDQYAKQVAPAIKSDVELGLWYFVATGEGIDPATAPNLLARLQRFNSELTQKRDGLTNRFSPAQAIASFIRATNELTVLLVIFSIPLLAVALYFIIMVAGMVVRRQASEIAVLRSRGASSFSIALLYVVAGVLVGGVGLLIGLAAGYGLAVMMTRLTTFLVFANSAALPVHLGAQAMRLGAVAAGVGVAASLLPALAASRSNILNYRTAQSRNTQAPFWQRAFLDVMLLVPSVYAYWQMRTGGGIALNPNGSTDPFADPVRFLAPVLLLAACALLLVRFFPWVMRTLAYVAAKLPVNTSILLALRSLARAPATYIGPLLLLIFTLGLAVFSSSIANTLDQHLHDSTYFQVGADMRLVETGDSNKKTLAFGESPAGNSSSQTGNAAQPEEPNFYTFVPVGEHLRIPGVKAATRIGRYPAQIKAQAAPERSEFVGIDRADFTQVAFFRPDFAAQSMGELMNQLALVRNGVLVRQDFLSQNRLRVGEPLFVTVNTLGFSAPLSLTIVGTYDAFPNPNRRAEDRSEAFIGNLDYLFENAGSALPYDVLLATAPNTSLDAVVDAAGGLGYLVLTGSDARQTIASAQTKPERQGVFGLLSAGFIAASLLTFVGFILSALITFRARAIQLSMLRTVGLSAGQMGAFIVLEQAVLVGLGALAGSGLGLLVSRLFIPFMQVGGTLASTVPPFVVRIAWANLSYIYAALGLALLVALAIMLGLLRRLKAFEAIKLGAT